uniref:Ig-like domain-containing protein n=1 Tax=Oncorhynchus tshawytscha TaxID=74940 RepID=A0A8C8CXB9_ONCTS
ITQRIFYCLCTCLSIVEFEIKVPSELQLSIVGQHAVLDCSFPVGKVWDLASSVITWQRGLEVIHSFYYGHDQLDRQSRHYRGNASLMLDHTNLGDKGDYTCSVSTVPGSQKKTFPLKLAAFYPEPHLDFTASPSNVELVLTSEGGYPRPLVQWLDDRGDVTDNSHTSFRGHTWTIFCLQYTDPTGTCQQDRHFRPEEQGPETDQKSDHTSEANRQYPGFEKPLTLPLLHKC